jgi:hypothetical protein
MRNTEYAQELRDAGVIRFDDINEGRIERLLVKELGTEEIRFSWWKNGNITTRPLDLTEADLITLFRNAIENRVFTDHFKSELRNLL